MASVTSKPGSNPKSVRQRVAWFWALMLLAMGASLHAQDGTTVSARFAAVKGVVMVSTQGHGEKRVHKGDTIRAGTIISCGAEGGASLKPLPTLHVIIYPDTKLRFDGAKIQPDGGGGVLCTIVSGKALFHIDQSLQQDGRGGPLPVIKVTVVTEEGVVLNHAGGKPEAGDGGKPATTQITTSTWTVRHDEGRTVVAVGEGQSNVSIGKGSAAANGEVGGQVKVLQGCVIWLFNRGGRVQAELVDTQTGKVTNLTGGAAGGSNLVEQSKQQLGTPSSSGTSSTSTTTPGGGGGISSTQPTNTSSNPDLSTPQNPRPVVSAETP